MVQGYVMISGNSRILPKAERIRRISERLPLRDINQGGVSKDIPTVLPFR